jgi:predicted amidohydrolase
METKERMLHAAVIQIRSNDTGDKEYNKNLIRDLVGKCVKEVRQKEREENEKQNETREKKLPFVVLLPEFAILGYSFSRDLLWKGGETLGGDTEQFLQQLSVQHEIFIGCSFLEATKEGHFFNTFSLSNPSGEIKGRVRKSRPAGLESYFFSGAPSSSSSSVSTSSSSSSSSPSSSSHVIEVDGFRFGVLICYENYLTSVIQELQNTEPLDLVLQPFSGPLYEPRYITLFPSPSFFPSSFFVLVIPSTLECTLAFLTFFFFFLRMDLYNDRCPFIAQCLAAPALYCNKQGPWSSPGMVFESWKYDSPFPGQSTICDAHGTILQRLPETGDTWACQTVEVGRTTGATKRFKVNEETYGEFAGGSWVLKLCNPLEWLGTRNYTSSEKRKEMALEIVKKHQGTNPKVLYDFGDGKKVCFLDT